MKQVVFIMTDTTRSDMLGCYGNPQMITPNLDKLASEGLKYTQAYTCQPVCGPARSALFTGTFPHSNGMVTNSIAMGDNVKTIGQRLKDQGVNCGYIGKWHLDGSDYFGNGCCPDGWDEDYWYDMRCYLNELSEDDRARSRKAKTSFDPEMTASFTYAHRCSDRAISFLDANKEQDFFLSVSYDEPHAPSLCPAPYNTMYDGVSMPFDANYGDDLKNKPLLHRLWAGEGMNKTAEELHAPSKELALFLGCNTFADMEIGRVIDKVRETCPNAMIIFTSDHGDMLGSHRSQGKNASAYKEIAKIPLIIKGGAVGTIDTPASHIDIVPTVLEYMGKQVPKVLEGTSMMPQITDPTVTVRDHAMIEFTRYETDHDGFGGVQPMRAIVDNRYKLVVNLLDTDELYDMVNDDSEMVNLINDTATAQVRDQLHDRLLQHMDETRDLYRGYQWACRPWRADKVASWANGGYTRQRENEEYELRQLDYDTGLPMIDATRNKNLNAKVLQND